MWYISVFDAKESASRSDLNRERAEWVRKNMDKTLKARCRTVKRYEVLGSSPQKIFLVIETDDPAALNLLSVHFGDIWNSVTHPVVDREIAAALEEDHSVIGG
ncbi:MAG: hypothetical protein C4526_08820 [Nitrospiraceae bacterium]|nr:MAG: hypothetical protein C4526_08820 [Nitrospiraceae bacterium]